MLAMPSQVVVVTVKVPPYPDSLAVVLCAAPLPVVMNASVDGFSVTEPGVGDGVAPDGTIG
jgi:hypothetical protein